jgi:ubiquinone/menaquinone biosynthesis C-methylase UbiE
VPGGTVTQIFHYDGFDIPLDLVELTGGGPDTWHDISVGHLREYDQYCPVEAHHNVLEIGCGVGRDAIQLARLVKPPGSYTGIDIIRPSIEWCQQNITTRYPHFRFVHLDIRSQIHNPGGALNVSDVSLPVLDSSIDRVILQSVFTHMFEADIVHYMREFHRSLRAGGKVFASFFLVDEESLKLAKATKQPLTFQHYFRNGCLINDAQYPEGAVGYTEAAFSRMLRHGGFELDQPVHRGFWCGRQGVVDGQDIAILRPIRRGFRHWTRSLFARRSLRSS